VGKTAIVEGLAQKIVANQVPSPWRTSSSTPYDLGALVAGSSVYMSGDFEERLKKVLKEIRNPRRHHLVHSTRSTPPGRVRAPLKAPLTAASILQGQCSHMW